jgi:hypothetical protein
MVATVVLCDAIAWYVSAMAFMMDHVCHCCCFVAAPEQLKLLWLLLLSSYTLNDSLLGAVYKGSVFGV